jgi:ribonucleoside-diphosphate reductase alpha chain
MKYDRMSRIGNTVQYAGIAKAYMDRNPGKELPRYFVGSMDLSPEAHVMVHAIAQKYVCSSISNSCHETTNVL